MKEDLSEKAKENLRRNEDSRKKDSMYVKLDPGEKKTLHFNAEKMEPVEVEFDEKRAHDISTPLLTLMTQISRKDTSLLAKELRQ
jgi:hypothetical protein